MSRVFIPDADVVPSEGQRDRGKAQMRNHRHWIVDRGCKRPELIRGRDRLSMTRPWW